MIAHIDRHRLSAHVCVSIYNHYLVDVYPCTLCMHNTTRYWATQGRGKCYT